MADPADKPSFTSSTGFKILVLVLVAAIVLAILCGALASWSRASTVEVGNN